MEVLITQYINSYEDSDLEFGLKYAKSLCELIITKYSLLEFVRALGSRLTSEDPAQRAGSLGCLAATLQCFPPSKLSRQDISVMVDFFIGKLDDKFSLKYVFHGLFVLIGSTRLTAENLEKVLNSLLQYEPGQHLAKIRHEPFSIIKEILNTQLPLISSKESSHLLIKTFIHIATGEKDPKNLMISFQITEQINKFEFDISDESEKYFVDELFDNCFCYFPISFKPPPNDPYKISAQDLKESLRLALTSQDLFAKDLFSNLFEKLTSTNPNVRNDVLETLLLAVDRFHEDTVLQYWETIWNGLKFEILHLDNLNGFDPAGKSLIPEFTNDDDNSSIYLCLNVLNALSIKIDNVHLESVVNDLKPNLTINNKYFKSCVLLLTNIASTSAFAFNYIVRFIFNSEHLGKFIDMVVQDDEEDVAITINKQRDLIDSFGFIFIAYQMIKLPTIDPFYRTNELVTVKDNLIIFMGQILQGSSNLEKTLKVKVVQQYIKLLELREFLSEEEKTSIMNLLNELFLSFLETPSDVLVSAILDGLIGLIHNGNDETTRLISENFIPSLLAKLDTHPEVFHIFERIIVNYQLLENLSIRLINKLGSDHKFNSNVIELIIKLIYKVQNSQQFLMNSWYKNFVPQLFRVTLRDTENIEIYSELIGIIVKYNDVSKHQEIMDHSVNIFYKGQSGLNLPGYRLWTEPHKSITIMTKILANLDKSVVLDTSAIPNLETMVEFIGQLKICKLDYLQHLSLLVNKYLADPSELELQYSKLSIFEIQVWIIKGLVLRLNKLGMSKLNELLEESSVLNPKVYFVSFDIILKDLKIFQANKELPKGVKIISKTNHLNVKMLYKQQVFNIILNKIIGNETVLNLNLLSILTKNVDSSILKLRINEILPLVLKSLNYKNLLESALNNLQIIIDSGTDLTNHLPFLFKKLIEVSNLPNESVKYLALVCILKLIKSLSRDLVLIYKQELLLGSVKNLDDSKRVVRKLTCDIRHELFELR